MAIDLTEAARSGYQSASALSYEGNIFLASSPAWYGWHAGHALRASGRTPPVKATMGRGYSVNIETAATRFVAKFGTALPPTIERKD